MDAATKPEARRQHSALREKFIALAGDGHARSATAADAVAGLQPKLVIEPGTAQELAEILRLSNEDRKSTRLNSSHQIISYAVFCLKKKKKNSYSYVYRKSDAACRSKCA